MAKNKKNNKSKKSNEENVPLYKYILFGQFVSSEYFARHWLKIFVCTIFIMMYIASKYQLMTRMETVKKLENELEIVKTERVREHSTYMSRTRESAMQALADTVTPGLTVQEQPPYTLKL
jgi:Bacteriodetes cell division protein (FtsL-like)